ncbi:MAG: ADP compounds hydrolase NudE [Gammaproteobacteria bacterium]|nr:MAG: ADP compounds hydrolase NudE [Gammaproteobacteria bacterium]
MPKTLPRIIKKSVIAKTRLFKVEALDLVFSNGASAQYERLISSSAGAVLIIPMLDNETVLLIREYNAGVHRYELALPKGRVEAQEDWLDAANREMQEEIGYAARSLEHLRAVTIAPGYLSHETQIILAQDLYESRLQGDEPEEIEVIPWKLSELDKLMVSGEISEARSIAALYIVRDKLNGSY